VAADKDENAVPPQPQEVSIVDEGVHIRLEGEDEGTVIHIAKTQPDGTMRSWSLLIGRDPDSNERIISLDEDGTLIHVPIVTDEDGNKLPIAGTEDGVLRVDIAGAAKSQEIVVMNMILAELRLHTMHWQEMVDPGFKIEDLGERTPTEAL